MADTKLSQLTLKTGDMVASDLVEITEGGNTTKSVTGTKILGFVSANITGITTSQADAIVANTAKTGITSEQASAITANTAKTGITSGQANAITANTAKVTNATHTGEVTGATALTIADNVVDEANLKVSNAPTNGYTLTAQSGNTGGLTWAAAGGAGDITAVVAGTGISGGGTSGTVTITNSSPNVVQTTVSGNAGTATTLQTARTIAGVAFDGSANISLNNNAITNGAGYTTNTGDITGVTAGSGMSGGGTSGTVTITNAAPNIVQTTVTGSSGSCTGNAATATSASNIDGRPFTNTNSNSATNANTIESNGISYYSGGVDNFSGNATDGALYSQAYSSVWQHQIAGDYRSGQIALRGKNNNTWQAWRKVWDVSNDGSGSGLDADLLDGFSSAESGANTIHKLTSSGYSNISNWTQVSGAGIYSATTNSAHFNPNTSGSYGTWSMNGSRGGYSGIYHIGGGGVTSSMYDASGNGGEYRQAGGGWYTYYHLANACMGISGSTTSSAYSLYVSGAIYATGNITAYSDRRVKENIRTIDNALETVEEMRGVYYNRIDDPDKTTQIGFIAQEVNDVVGAEPLVTYAEDVDQYGVSYGNTTALLVESIKELSQQVKDLQTEIKEMKNA